MLSIYLSIRFYDTNHDSRNYKNSNKDWELLSNSNNQITTWGIKFFDDVLKSPYVGDKTIKIAVLDSGIYKEHEDLKDVVIKQYNAESPKYPVTDSLGHGTAIAGVIASNDNKFGIKGMSQNVEIIDIKVINDEGKVSVEAVIKGLAYAVKKEVDIISMSFGFKEENIVLEDSIKEATQNEIILVAAAGNNFGTETDFPAKYDDVLSVGSLKKDGSISEKSAKGKLDFLAPGEDILSTDELGSYSLYDGTSISVGFISGLIAEGLLRDEIKKTDDVAELKENITDFILK
ncbi:S8 family serine peptidase [Aquibacillus rhizosphaerae]|uniref:S8 family serine peptidase n=1 Tax=Aquibacillus rhizosphaerae TaxID=3051431 RepID=A0ABT7L9G5_9BACI|nr:S8 family serine peptidase [Aquibacillus sp. LR5S19]MDL4842508.1 S8 family serine peptidase [Aquibacillus sp. LR5S19]